jgi:hypothetical protein
MARRDLDAQGERLLAARDLHGALQGPEIDVRQSFLPQGAVRAPVIFRAR